MSQSILISGYAGLQTRVVSMRSKTFRNSIRPIQLGRENLTILQLFQPRVERYLKDSWASQKIQLVHHSELMYPLCLRELNCAPQINVDESGSFTSCYVFDRVITVNEALLGSFLKVIRHTTLEDYTPTEYLFYALKDELGSYQEPLLAHNVLFLTRHSLHASEFMGFLRDNQAVLSESELQKLEERFEKHEKEDFSIEIECNLMIEQSVESCEWSLI